MLTIDKKNLEPLRDLPDTDNAFFNIERGDLTDPFVTVTLDDVHLLKTAYIRQGMKS